MIVRGRGKEPRKEWFPYGRGGGEGGRHQFQSVVILLLLTDLTKSQTSDNLTLQTAG